MPSLTEFPAYARLQGELLGASASALAWSDGRELLDLYGGHCVNSLGAGDLELGATLQRQWQRLSFATNLVDQPGRQAFYEAWQSLMPHGSWQVFASNSGAEANENLLKMALAATGRSKVICFDGAFHGRTAAAAAVSDGASGFPQAPFEVLRLPWGSTEGIDASVGAVILEPIQSLAGVVDPPAGFLAGLRAACDASGAWLLFDEVQTGPGRLGSPWASQHFGVIPDAFSTAKGCASGFPLGLSFVQEAHASTVPQGLCGSTFGGAPMALAASAHVAQRIAAPRFLEHVQALGRSLHGLAGTGPVIKVRGEGLLIGLELAPGLTAKAARDGLLQQGILTGTSQHPQVLRLSPPLNLPGSAVGQLARALSTLPYPVAPLV
jgi:acetylornithine/succinyldiaminopimelate/putrescine aminotransferase